ncbi:MAG: MFS transporter [Acutalibacteraceae bacterium]|nr:glycoside-pentoside-hexuronide (GPH):cation symporter [Oscillospiraceae bacterium]
MARKEKSTEPKPVNDHPNKIGIKEASGYMLGDAGNLFNLTYISTYLKLFMTDVLQIKDNAKIAVMMLISRLWDCINDPLWGKVVAKRSPRKDGKFRPYLKTVCVPLGIATILCFAPWYRLTTNQTILLAICYVTYIFYGMMYTGMNIPFGSLASVITDDPKGRTLLSTFRSIGSGVGGGVVSFLAPMLIFTKTGEIDEITKKEIKVADGSKMFIFAIAMGVLSIVFYLWSYATTKERVPSEPDPKINFRKTYSALFHSRPFITVALAGLLISGQLQFNSFNTYLYKNYFCNTNLSILGTVCNYLPMVVLILFMPKLVEKYGKKELCGNTSIIAAVAAVLLAIGANSEKFISFVNHGQDGIFPAWLFMLALFVIGFGYTFVSLTCWAVVMDVIDYQEYTTGERSESAIYAVYTFSRKLGQTIADTSGLFLLKWAKYDGSEAGYGFITENNTSNRLMFICTIIPAFVYTGVWLLMKFGYPLTKEKLEPIYAKVHALHAQAEIDAENS